MNFKISSKDNPTFKNIRKLLTSRSIKEDRQFFLIGEKLIHEFLRKKHPGFKTVKVITFDGAPDLPLFPNPIILSNDLFNEIDTLGTHYPILVVEYRDFEPAQLNQVPQGLEIVSPLGDPKNFGALARTAVAMGASKIILTHESCHPFLPQSVKASAGAVLDIPFEITPMKISELAFSGKNYALDLSGEDIKNVKWERNCRVILGEEGPGLNLSADQNKKIHFINIPTQNVESLNAMVSASIALWEWKKSF